MNSKKLHSSHKPITIILLLITCTTMLIILMPLWYPFLVGYPIYLFKQFSSSYDHYYFQTSTSTINIDDDPSPFHPVEASSSSSSSSCDIFTGEWVPNPEAPYYTNTTCWAIHDHQNCMRYGRPDIDFTKWKWKPDGCDLPVLDPAQFLETVRGKSLAFVGDSVSRNQMQSLMCLLSRVEYPIDVSYTSDEQFKRWNYTSYNFLMATLWAPYLVRAQEADPNLGPNQTPGLFSLYLDEVNQDWTTQIQDFDYVIISAGHWFFRPLIYHENGNIVGCRFCQLQNVTDYPMSFGYKKAFRTAFRAINSMKDFKGVTFLRTFAPSHYENGEWNDGGDCPRQGPLRSNATSLEGWNFELYMTQVEEFRAAERVARENGLKFRLLDTTQATLMRPDGHPSRFGHAPNANVSLHNDCVHWCLPGPIDTWNDFLLEMLKMEEDVSSYEDEEKLHTSDRKLRFLK